MSAKSQSGIQTVRRICIVGASLALCAVGVMLLAERRDRHAPSDPAHAYEDLEQRLRHRWRYRAETLRRWARQLGARRN